MIAPEAAKPAENAWIETILMDDLKPDSGKLKQMQQMANQNPYRQW